MVKIASNDVIAILRKFDLAGDENVPRHVEQLKISHPNEINTLISFRFNKTQFYILADDTAEDDVEYIHGQVQDASSDANGKLIENPKDSTMTYGLPFKGKDIYLYQIISNKKRLDVELAERYPEYSRSTWQKYIKAGYVSVNGEVKESVKSDVTAADSIAVSIPDAQDYTEESLPIVYLDDNVIVINKPLGVLSHSKGALNEEFTVADFFRRYSTYNAETNRPGIVHRLDRDTSGIMIGARNAETATLLQKQFADRRAKKTYFAVIDGALKETKAMVDLPIGRNPSAPSTFRVDAGGKPAQTAYEVIDSNDTYSLVELRPKTGRTHQLRVHMAYLGTPIHGDKVYGKEADRLYLHAHSLEVTIPTSNRQTFTAPTPPEFKKMVS
ncbi:RluA family pseudouridine synthase [Candidatus Saccharibacteria bacterium]|nr:RluA family pseudouridine synthase [Candidatus Saccharibacteria bacterium]